VEVASVNGPSIISINKFKQQFFNIVLLFVNVPVKLYMFDLVISTTKDMEIWSFARVNLQHPPAHHAGWMVYGQETFLCCIPMEWKNHGD
jgi:hypothetical protein